MNAPRGASRRRLSPAAAVASLGALAQETRLAAFRALVQAGPGGLAAGELSERLGVSPANLSFHLSALAAAGLVNGLPRGRFVIYAANFAAMNALVGFLSENCCGGNACGPGQASNVCAPKEHTP